MCVLTRMDGKWRESLEAETNQSDIFTLTQEVVLCKTLHTLRQLQLQHIFHLRQAVCAHTAFYSHLFDKNWNDSIRSESEQ